jgi:DNA modification methylase
VIEPIEVRRPLGDNPATATLFYGASCLETLRRLPDESVHCMVTSPPYWGLRDYSGEPQVWGGDADCDHEWGEMGRPHHPNQVEQTKWKSAEAAGKGQTAGSGQLCQKCGAWLGQFGLEPTPQMYTEHLVEIFREIRRVLRDDGTCWLNLGDSYAGSGPSGASYQSETTKRRAGKKQDGNFSLSKRLVERGLTYDNKKPVPPPGLKSKDLVGIPWRSAFALQDDGWYLRSEIIWHKPNPLPESVRDRVTRAHEHIFMFAKKAKYFYDHDAIKEPLAMTPQRRLTPRSGMRHEAMRPDKKYDYEISDEPQQQGPANGRNKRSVWTVTPKPYRGAHFAVFPPELIEPCVLAGTSEKGCCPMCGNPWERATETEAERDWREDLVEVAEEQPAKRRKVAGWHPTCGCPEHEPIPCKVLDPFSGSGTTGVVCLDHGRDYVGLDINSDYRDLAVARLLGEDAPSRAEEDEGGGILELLGVQEG